MNPQGTPGRAAAGHPRYNGPPPYANSVNDEDPTMMGSDPRPGALRLLTATEMSANRPSVIPSAISNAASAFVTHDAVPPTASPRKTVDDWAEREQKFAIVEPKSVSFDFADIEIPPLATTPKQLSSSRINRFEFNRNQITETNHLPDNNRISPVQRAYHPSTSSLPYQRMHDDFADSPGRPGSATAWTPTRHSQDFARPPSSVQYEPEHLNGSPRPGTPSGRYSNSGNNNKRPLPPAPLFAGGSRPDSRLSRNDEGMTSIPIDGEDDVFAEFNNDLGVRGMRSHESFASDDTFADEERQYSDDDDDEKVKHVGPAPEGPISRRGNREVQMTKKEVQLVNGELILECKIPTTLHSFLPHRGSSEFTHMRYTAVTCDPDDFVARGYQLRQNYGSTLRETELFICITMYNEDEVNFTRTMHGVMRNIMHFCSRTKSRTWGKDGWQKIVVCIISDGRSKVHPRTLDALAAMGVYQPGIAKNQVNQKEVTAHVYEYTTQVSLNADLKFKSKESGIVPCQIIFCLKEKNQKKLNSHRWFFNAFGRALNPNICILLDVGTKPDPTALYHLWKAFDNDSSVAGAAGEIIAGKGKGWLGLLNPLVASQNFEYKMSNILDKPLESVFGYITVLPGALSAYRYIALQNDENGHGPLSQYFKGETLHGQDADVFTANMYLAEDRILCWELVAKRNEHWVLKFVKRAKGETDVPDAIPEFISQRRRWLNGAFFAAVYSLLHFRQVWTTDHSFARKFMLHIEFIYQFINLMFTFFSLANFYLTFYFIAGSLADPKMDPFGHHIGNYIFVILRYLCVLVICVQFILSMGNRPQGAPKMYLTSMTIYGIIMTYTTFCALYIVVIQLKSPDTSITIGNNVFTNLIVSTASTIGIYFLMSFLYLDPWHMFTSSAQYFALLPSYICTLQVYAFCNTHDVTWGTKGDNVVKTDLGTATGKGNSQVVELEMPTEQRDIDTCYDEALFNLKHRVEVEQPEVSESQKQEDYYRAIRTYMVVVWLVANAVLAMAISEAYSAQNVADNVYLKFILWSVAIVALFRAIGSTSFAILSIVHSIAEGREKWSSKWEGSSWGSGFGASSFGGQGGRIGADGATVVSAHRSKLKRPSTFSMPKMSMPSMPNIPSLKVEKPTWMSNAGGWLKKKVPGMG